MVMLIKVDPGVDIFCSLQNKTTKANGERLMTPTKYNVVCRSRWLDTQADGCFVVGFLTGKI